MSALERDLTKISFYENLTVDENLNPKLLNCQKILEYLKNNELSGLSRSL
jgi:hypothetical protein